METNKLGFRALRVCLFTGMEGTCNHSECLYGKTQAQAQRPKSISNGGLMAGLQQREERVRFREVMSDAQKRANAKHGSW